jgi:hypothetical protein
MLETVSKSKEGEKDVSEYNADFAARVMNISMLDVEDLPPLSVWLLDTPLSSIDECISDLKEL